MLKRALILTALLVAVLVFLRENGGHDGGASRSGRSGMLHPAGHRIEADETVSRPTKASRRDEAGLAATHSPARLKEFYLPEVEVAGLPLEAALEKLRGAYDDACRESGEVPVRLAFHVPPGRDRPLTVKLGVRTLDSAIRRLAAVSGLKVTRDGSTYVFTVLDETGATVTRELRVPPDFGFIDGRKLSPAEWFAAQGVVLDPATRLVFRPGAGTLQLETTRAADAQAVNAMVQSLATDFPIQHRLEARVVELAAGSEWTPPDTSQLDEGSLQALFHDLTEKGAQLTTLPAITARTGEQAKIEMVRELIVPLGGGGGEEGFETHVIGKVLDLTPVPLGFGHRVDLNFTDTTGGFDEDTLAAKVDRRTDIGNTSFSPDGQARVHVETRPDGTRTVLLVTPTLIDATGRPLRGQE